MRFVVPEASMRFSLAYCPTQEQPGRPSAGRSRQQKGKSVFTL